MLGIHQKAKIISIVSTSAILLKNINNMHTNSKQRSIKINEWCNLCIVIK